MMGSCHGITGQRPEVVCASVDMASPLATPKSPELVSIELGASKALTVKLISFGYTRPEGMFEWFMYKVGPYQLYMGF